MSAKTCTIPGCDRPYRCKGLCALHYKRLTNGWPMLAPATPEGRFWAKLDKRPDGCWEWTKTIERTGYGRMCGVGGKCLMAHRVAYEYANGPIPDGLYIDHLCANKRCCNPAHLEAVTPAENTRRYYASLPNRNHCPRGHELTPENSWPRGEPHHKPRCRTCEGQTALRVDG